MSRRPAARASRRGLLGGTLVGLTAAGCSLDPPADAPTRRDARSEATPAETGEDPDARLVRGVVDDLTAALALVGGVARTRGPLARAVEPWRRMHAAHLEALEAPDRARPLRVRGSSAAVREQLRREESSLQRRLAEASASARSGALAALLATMSAAVAQRLAADAAGGRG